ncbi:rhodanese-like domain-containing protein [Lutimonas sp.]|uniref:rhodanese-like domain-containing protein n=1 Tax=Lutimonas sp. TaxID=1872403 RepID=UPI003D9AE88C
MSTSYKTKKIVAKRSYQFLAVLLLILAGTLLFLPKNQKQEGISPELFVKNILSTERYIGPDVLADRMINEDPVLLLVDTRTFEEYQTFSLPNAINIPLTEIFSEELNPYLNQDIYDVVLFSNDNFTADQAWMLCNRMSYQRLYVLQGGINAWFETIIHPEAPAQTMSQEAFDLYSFRRAAGSYFGVANDTLEIEIKPTKATPVKKVVTKPKKKKRMPEGGC